MSQHRSYQTTLRPQRQLATTVLASVTILMRRDGRNRITGIRRIPLASGVTLELMGFTMIDSMAWFFLIVFC